MTGLVLAHLPVTPTVGSWILAAVSLAVGAGIGAYLTTGLAAEYRAQVDRLESALTIIADGAAALGEHRSAAAAANVLNTERSRR